VVGGQDRPGGMDRVEYIGFTASPPGRRDGFGRLQDVFAGGAQDTQQPDAMRSGTIKSPGTTA
jgi:hypothetical protein